MTPTQQCSGETLSVSRVAEKINEEFEIGCRKELISPQNLARLVAELASERMSSRTALVTMNQRPVDDPQEARKQIDKLCFERFYSAFKNIAAPKTVILREPNQSPTT